MRGPSILRSSSPSLLFFSRYVLHTSKAILEETATLSKRDLFLNFHMVKAVSVTIVDQSLVAAGVRSLTDAAPIISSKEGGSYFDSSISFEPFIKAEALFHSRIRHKASPHWVRRCSIVSIAPHVQNWSSSHSGPQLRNMFPHWDLPWIMVQRKSEISLRIAGPRRSSQILAPVFRMPCSVSRVS